MIDPEQILRSLEASNEWPPKSEQTAIARVLTRRAFRQADEVFLRDLAGWHKTWGRKTRQYVTDPLPGLISRAFADLLFGDEPRVLAAADRDQPLLDAIVTGNHLASELHRAARMQSSEGEAWYRVYVDKDVADVPLIQWVSRSRVIPVLHGPTVTGCTFISTVCRDEETVWRHLEVQAPGVTLNALYRGTYETLGQRADMAARPETDGLPDAWEHGLPILAGRVLNGLDDDPCLGRSDYQGIERLLLALNEAATIGVENARLTAKKRLFVNGSLVEVDGTFDAGADVIQVNALDGEMGETGSPPIAAVEYSFDAEALIAYTRDLTDKILTRVGVAPELVGRAEGTGRAESGTAIRTRLLHSVLAAGGKGRFWDDELPHELMLTQLVDSLSVQDGGFGRSWAKPAEQPVIERGDVLPHDDMEEAQRHSFLLNAEAESRETAVRELHPDWNDDQVREELARIAAQNTIAPVPNPDGTTAVA